MAWQEHSFVVDSGYRCFAVFGAQRPTGDERTVDSTLVEWLQPSPDEPILIVKAGAQFGPYGVRLRIGDGPPEDTANGPWEDVAEISLVASEQVALGDLEAGWGDAVPVRSGEHRLRVSAMGRTESAARESAFQDEDDSDEDEPLEHFLLEMWPAPFAHAVVIGETSRYARDLVSPPEPDWPAEREPGLEAARRIAADLAVTGAARTLTGRLAEVFVRVEVDGTPVRMFDRVKHAHAWMPGNGGTISRNDAVGDRCVYYGDPPNSDGLAPLLGTVETTVLQHDRPRQLTLSWNWRVAGPDGAPYPTNPRLLREDATAVMTFADAEPTGGEPRTLITIHHSGIPVEWVEDLELLWKWDLAVCVRR